MKPSVFVKAGPKDESRDAEGRFATGGSTKVGKAPAKTQADFETLLKIPTKYPAEKIPNLVQARIANLKLGEVCNRCGGSGQHSYNPQDGTRCFKCRGSGYQPVKLSSDLYQKLVPLVASGVLDRNIAEAIVRARIKKDADTAVERVMTAWEASGVSKEYDWRKSGLSRGMVVDPVGAYHAYISTHFNKPMSEAYDRVQALRDVLWKLTPQKPTDAESREKRDEAILEASKRLNEGSDQAVAEIKALASEMRVYLSTHKEPSVG